MTFFAFVFCFILYIKGRLAPSSPDCHISGNPLFDFYWGTELYPRIFGWDVKVFTNCRYGMMGWALMLLCFAYKQAQTGLTDAMLVSVTLQLVYIAKFFWWESGYLRSLDIMHDRAGFYICWGCLVWLPSIYSSCTMYLVEYPIVLGTPLASFIFIGGLFFIWMNWDADNQRHAARQAWNEGREFYIWGYKARMIEASFLTERGQRKRSALLASGWWSVSRHFHYIPEILASAFWILPCLFGHFMPWFYVAPYLTLLLLERGLRDDIRCAKKYQEDWDVYCEAVPYRFIPFVF